jgi:hypothetical protein
MGVMGATTIARIRGMSRRQADRVLVTDGLGGCAAQPARAVASVRTAMREFTAAVPMAGPRLAIVIPPPRRNT